MKKMIFAIATMFMCASVNAANLSASEKIQELISEQSALQDQALKSDVETALVLEDFVIDIDRKIEALLPELLSERETLREQALACGNDVVAAMELTKKVIRIDGMLEFLGYEEPYDDCVDD